MKEKIMAILEDVCGADEGELSPDTRLFEDGILDSFGVISLFVEIETQLGIKLEPTELDRDQLATPALIIAEVEKRA